MYPILHLFGRQFSSYAVMAGLGIILGLVLIVVLQWKDKSRLDNCIYIYGIGILGAILGAKVLYILTVLGDFVNDLPLIATDGKLFITKYLSFGWVFYGGLIGGILFAYLTARSFKLKLSDYTADIIPGVIVFAGVGRIGCFLAGCCYGIEADCPISVVFPQGGMAPAGIPIIPTQIIEAFCDLGMLIVIIAHNKHTKMIGDSKTGIGALSLYLIMYSIMRFSLEFVRGDIARGSFLFFSTSQWISIVLLLIVIIYNLRKRGRA